MAHGICLRFFDVSVEHATRIERINDVEELDDAAGRLFEGPLADCARVNGIDFEFQSITVPLIVGLEQLCRSLKIMDVPKTYDRRAPGRLRRWRKPEADAAPARSEALESFVYA